MRPSEYREWELSRGGLIMETNNRFFALVLGVSLALTAPSASWAAIVETIYNTDTDAAVGSISFPALTGSSATGVLFSYDGFSQSDITSISWSIDPSTYAVTALDLSALQGDNPCPNGNLDCSNRTVSLSPTLAESGGASCSFSGDFGLCSERLGFADIAFRPIPEPSTWTMMLLGFAGLGFVGYRTSRKAAAISSAAKA